MTINSKSYPLILIEGLNGVGKSTQVQELSKILSAQIISTPQFLEDPLFPKQDLRIRMYSSECEIRREYYRNANFYASDKAKQLLSNGPVILDRYWCSTAAYSAMDDNPPKWKDVGLWPTGLVVPDIVFLLTADESNRHDRLSNRGDKLTNEEIKVEQENEKREKVLEYYRRFDPIEIDTSNITKQEISREILFWLKTAEIIADSSALQMKLPERGCVYGK